MLAYTTKRINYLFKEPDTLFKRIIKSLFFTKSPYVKGTTLRKIDINFKRTKSEQLEWNKCNSDIVYFADNYCDVISPYGQKSELRDYQRDLLHSYVNNKRVIVLNSRQMGLSTLHRIYALWLLLFRSELIYHLTNKLEVHYNDMQEIRKMYRNIPYFMQKGVKAFNQIHIELTDSKITNSKVKKPTVVLADNAAYYIKYGFSELQRVIQSDSNMVISSTPHVKNYFYDIWQNAEDFSLKPIRIHASLRPEWDNAWREKMINVMGLDAFNNEFNLLFKSKE